MAKAIASRSALLLGGLCLGAGLSFATQDSDDLLRLIGERIASLEVKSAKAHLALDERKVDLTDRAARVEITLDRLVSLSLMLHADRIADYCRDHAARHAGAAAWLERIDTAITATMEALAADRAALSPQARVESSLAALEEAVGGLLSLSSTLDDRAFREREERAVRSLSELDPDLSAAVDDMAAIEAEGRELDRWLRREHSIIADDHAEIESELLALPAGASDVEKAERARLMAALRGIRGFPSHDPELRAETDEGADGLLGFWALRREYAHHAAVGAAIGMPVAGTCAEFEDPFDPLASVGEAIEFATAAIASIEGPFARLGPDTEWRETAHVRLTALLGMLEGDAAPKDHHKLPGGQGR